MVRTAALLAGLGLAVLVPLAANAGEERILVERIEIRGAAGQEEAIKSQMRIAEGKSYPADAFDRLIENDVSQLWKWGVFVRDVSPREPRGKIVLVLDVEMRIRIASIEFEGLDALEEEDVLPLLLVKEGSATDDSLLQVSCDRLKVRYRDEGYRFASVTYELKRRRGARAGLVFKVEEGPRTRIDDIVFLGNRSVRSGRLRSVMETERSDLFTPTRLQDDVLRRDVAAVEQFYREEGWRDATAALEDLAYSDDLGRVVVVIRVSEGERYAVESVEVRGNENVPLDRIVRKIRLRPGLYYRSRLVYGDFEEEEKGDFKRIYELYGDQGYLNARIRVDETFDDRAKTVKVVYRIEEGKKVRVRRVLFAGNEKTRDDVIRRMITISPGEVFKNSDIERSRAMLEQSRYFAKVDLRDLPTGIPDEKDFLLDVEETRTGDIRFIAAYNQSTQFMGRIELRFRNFDLSRLPTSMDDLLSGRAFAGGGQTLTIQMTAGMEKQLIYSLQFEEPAFFGTRTSFQTSVFRFQRDWGPYLERRTGATLGFGRRLADFLSVRLNYRFVVMELRDISAYAPPDVFLSQGPDEISSLTGEIAVDFAERTAFGMPFKGFEASASYEYAYAWEMGSVDFGTVNFHKAQVEASLHQTVFGEVSEWRHILSIRARVAWADTHHHAWGLPVYERYYLGGLGTLRGFGYRGVGPRQNGSPVGGNFMATGTVEYSIPLYRAPMPGMWRQELDVLRLVLFYDVGALAPNYEDFSTRLFRAGIGFGFRLMVPALGGVPIMLDFGWPVSRQPGDDTERVSFSLGWFF